jgi:predicted dehydrogenase
VGGISQRTESYRKYISDKINPKYMLVKKIALIGLGSIGRRHLRLIKEIRPDIDVTLVRSGFGQAWPEEKLANRVVKNVEEVISEHVQAAIISSPSTEHLRQADELVLAGVHLLVEKPLSHSLDNVINLLEKVESQGIVGLVGYIFHYDPAAQKFYEILQSHALGELLHARVECGSYLPDWRPEQDYRKTVSAASQKGGGVLLELSHELDYIRWFLGDIHSVQASLFNSGYLEIEVEESADLILTNKRGIPISMHLDFNRRHPSRFCSIQGTKGQLIWNVLEKKVMWQSVNGNPEVESFDIERDYMYREQLYHFLDCIENGTKPAVGFNDGVVVLRLVDAARQSHEISCKVVLP